MAVDWSGAKGPRLPGLQAAWCRPGRPSPTLFLPPPGTTWSRHGIVNATLDAAKRHGPVLLGIDAAMAFPFVDRRAYFPGHPHSPPNVESLWRAVERESDNADDFYAGSFGRAGKIFADYLNTPGHRGTHFDNQRGRLTEWKCRETWTRPSSVFNGVGAGSVGMGSLAAMRLALALRRRQNLRIAIWPFDPIAGADVVVVEIFPRLYVVRAELDPRGWRDPGFLNRVFQHYNTRPIPDARRSEDETDALLSAAALRTLALQPETWTPPDMTRAAARYEGWIFGVV